MKPYDFTWRLPRPRAAQVFQCLLLLLLLTSGVKDSAAFEQRTEAPPAAPRALVIRPDDAATRSGMEHFYSLEYDQAVHDFELSASEHPGDAFALNHLLSAVLFRELFRVGALDTELYSDDSFLSRKPLTGDPATIKRILDLIDQALHLSEERLKRNPNDVEALYCRGVTRGLRATYVGLMERAWFSALRSALGARNDHERVLELSPGFTDAKMVVGVHNYMLGSLSWPVKVAATMIGVRGNRTKGIQYLYEAGRANGETNVDARIALSLFLRREQRYPEALELVRGLADEHPRNFLVAIEFAHLLNAAGHGPEAIAAYRKLIKAASNRQFAETRMERAYFGLAEALRGQRHLEEASEAYLQALSCKTADMDIRQRAGLSAGEMFDALSKRDLAVERYKAVLAEQSEGAQAQMARQYLKRPYRMP
jgi:tetratricopeptide (TPR) repeat protein